VRGPFFQGAGHDGTSTATRTRTRTSNGPDAVKALLDKMQCVGGYFRPSRALCKAAGFSAGCLWSCLANFAQAKADPRGWIWVTSEFCRNFGLEPTEAKILLRTLRQAGWIEVEYRGDPPQRFVRIIVAKARKELGL
jgi:hypothetical protein